MESEVLYPLVASIITLLITKGVDLFIQRRKEPLAMLQHQLDAADEISDAASTTIKYLTQELERVRAKKLVLEADVDEKDKIIREQAKLIATLSNGYPED